VSGIIGFVGLVVPHLVRLGIGPRHRRLLPAVLLLGGFLLLVADTIARSLLTTGEELPVGVVTAILGGPFFCYLLLHRKKYLQL
jgi:iron complex transport system permease protein